MDEILAGWIAGYAMALLATVAGVYLARPAGPLNALRLRVLPDVAPVALTVPLFTGAMIFWTAAGLVLGSIYRLAGLAEQPGAIGTPSWPFTLAMVALGWIAVPPLILLDPRDWWVWCGLALLFAGAFGWVMPALAGG